MMLTGPVSGACDQGSCAAIHSGQLSRRRPLIDVVGTDEPASWAGTSTTVS